MVNAKKATGACAQECTSVVSRETVNDAVDRIRLGNGMVIDIYDSSSAVKVNQKVSVVIDVEDPSLTFTLTLLQHGMVYEITDKTVYISCGGMLAEVPSPLIATAIEVGQSVYVGIHQSDCKRKMLHSPRHMRARKQA